MRGAKIGIGIITYDRLTCLQKCVEITRERTRTPFVLVVADDGSGDGSISWGRSQGIPVVTGRNRGPSWNMNRALFWLAEREECDYCILLEDDAYPTYDGWEEQWIAAVSRFEHLSWAYQPAESIPPEQGRGTPEDPYRMGGFGTQCTITSRAALDGVGYLDARFHGYGWGHAEWSWRIGYHYAPLWGSRTDLVPCLQHGIGATFDHSWNESADCERNMRLAYGLRDRLIRGEETVFRLPWRNERERDRFMAEIESAAH